MDRRHLLFTLLLAFVVGGGCECNPHEVARERPEAPRDPTQVVPTSARAAIEIERFDLALKLGENFAERFEADSALASTARRFENRLKVQPWQASTWRAFGISTDAPVRLFEDGGQWVIHAELETPEKTETWAAKATKSGTFTIARSEAGDFDLFGVSSGEGQAPFLYIATGEKHAFILPVGELEPRRTSSPAQAALTPEDVAGRVQRWSSLGKREQWNQTPWARRFSKAHEKHPVRGAIRPATWMATAEAHGDQGQAAVIYDRIRRQLGPVGFGLDFDIESASLRGSVLTSQKPNEPTFVEELSGARGEIPKVGGLITPGVLGVVRVSGAPEKFWALFRSLLPAESRLELDAIIKDYDDQLAVDLIADVLSNVKGHAVIAIYGFEPQVFRKDNPSLVSDIFGLRATREAVFVPIESRDRMEDVLNVMTQLSKGKLNRQATERSIQYAWIEEKTGLQWAILLADDHLVLVDSMPAFDHAVEYERNARPIGEVMRKRGLSPLLKGTDRSGIYLDSQALSNLLVETGNTGIASWIRPFSTIVLTAEGEKVELELRLDE